jgi:hypothetical protein
MRMRSFFVIKTTHSTDVEKMFFEKEKKLWVTALDFWLGEW